MKKSKKIICMALIALAAASSVTAAKKKKNDAYKNVQVQKNPKTKKKWDFGGMEVIIGDWWTDPTRPAASKQEEDLFAWRNWTNETYNVKVTQQALTGWGSNPQFVTNFCITGGEENYVLIIDGRSANQGVRANLFTDLSLLTPTINISPYLELSFRYLK